MSEVHFRLNGEEITLEVQPRWTLLHILREVLHLTGTKLLQFSNHIGIVDDAAQHHTAAFFLSRLASQFHGSLHAVAKAGTFGKDHFHYCSPSSFTCRITASTLA